MTKSLRAELPDARTLPIDSSLMTLEGLHARWTALLRLLTENGYQRRLRHPESGEWTLGWMLGLYAWRSHHHLAHIAKLRERMGW